MVISHRTTLGKREIIGVPRPSHDRTQRMIESKDSGELNLENKSTLAIILRRP